MYMHIEEHEKNGMEEVRLNGHTKRKKKNNNHRLMLRLIAMGIFLNSMGSSSLVNFKSSLSSKYTQNVLSQKLSLQCLTK